MIVKALLVRVASLAIAICALSITLGAVVWSAGASGHYGQRGTAIPGYFAAAVDAGARSISVDELASAE